MITLHHLEYSQSFRVLWLLEELGAEYELKKYDRDPETLLAPDDYKAISPLGTAPVITNGDLALAETSAIIEYLLDLYPNESISPPPSSKDRVQHLFWFHAAQGSIMPLMLMESVFLIVQKKVPGFMNFILKPLFGKISEGFIHTRMQRVLAKAEEDLASGGWFGGENLTSADIVLSYPLEAASMRGYLGDEYPKTRAWLERIHERPAFRTAREKDDRSSMVLPL